MKIKKIQIIVKNVGQYIFSIYIQTLLTQKVCHWPRILKVTNNTTNKGLQNTIHVISLSNAFFILSKRHTLKNYIIGSVKLLSSLEI